MTKLKKRLLLFSGVLAVLAATIAYFHFDYYSIPRHRIALSESYSEMPEDSFHHYINLPVDHHNTKAGSFRGFYLFSPHFYQRRNICFLLTDGQMELVSTNTDFDFFENVLQGAAYVLIGVRGQSPNLFPEVYKEGGVDFGKALRLFDSDQQVEDIELVRKDLVRKGVLGEDEKINVFGASGAGVLAQQYVSRYGAHVNRMILESTGAPDLARKDSLKYSPDFKDFNPEGALVLEKMLKERSLNKAFVCNILYQAGRSNKDPRAAQVEILKKLEAGGALFKYKIKPVTNLDILNYMIKVPSEIAARVRWFELTGYDLMRYNSQTETNLLYELSSRTISDLVAYCRLNHISPKEFIIDRKEFQGEVLILKGTEDVVFSDEINRKLQESYSHSRLLLFKDGHRMQNNVNQYVRIRNTFLDSGFASQAFKNMLP